MKKRYVALVLCFGVILFFAPKARAADCVINSFAVSKTSIIKGESVVVTWDTSGCAKVEITAGVGFVAASGVTTIKPTGYTAIFIYARKSDIDAAISKRQVITVTDPDVPCEVASFTADKKEALPVNDPVSVMYLLRDCTRVVITTVDTVTGKAVRDPIDLNNSGGWGGSFGFDGAPHDIKISLNAYKNTVIAVSKELIVMAKKVSGTNPPSSEQPKDPVVTPVQNTKPLDVSAPAQSNIGPYQQVPTYTAAPRMGGAGVSSVNGSPFGQDPTNPFRVRPGNAFQPIQGSVVPISEAPIVTGAGSSAAGTAALSAPIPVPGTIVVAPETPAQKAAAKAAAKKAAKKSFFARMGDFFRSIFSF